MSIPSLPMGGLFIWAPHPQPHHIFQFHFFLVRFLLNLNRPPRWSNHESDNKLTAADWESDLQSMNVADYNCQIISFCENKLVYLKIRATIGKFIYLSRREWFEAVVRWKPEKNSGLNGIRTHDLCDTVAVLYQLSYQTNCELARLRIRNNLYPLKVKNTNEYMKAHICELCV